MSQLLVPFAYNGPNFSRKFKNGMFDSVNVNCLSFLHKCVISGKIRSISGTGNLWIWRSKKIHYSPIQSYASAVVPDSFTLPSQQSAILASLEKEYGVYHGLIPDLELRCSKIQNLYGLRVKVCTCRKAVDERCVIFKR